MLNLPAAAIPLQQEEQEQSIPTGTITREWTITHGAMTWLTDSFEDVTETTAGPAHTGLVLHRLAESKDTLEIHDGLVMVTKSLVCLEAKGECNRAQRFER